MWPESVNPKLHEAGVESVVRDSQSWLSHRVAFGYSVQFGFIILSQS